MLAVLRALLTGTTELYLPTHFITLVEVALSENVAVLNGRFSDERFDWLRRGAGGPHGKSAPSRCRAIHAHESSAKSRRYLNALGRPRGSLLAGNAPGSSVLSSMASS